MLQVSQVPPQAVLQQKPSTQKPDWQESPSAQAVPSGDFAPHTPFEHMKPGAQPALLAQLLGHAAPLPSQT